MQVVTCDNFFRNFNHLPQLYYTALLYILYFSVAAHSQWLKASVSGPLDLETPAASPANFYITRAAPSKHSRAARRATSPSIDTDKSLKTVSLPRTTNSTQSRTLPGQVDGSDALSNRPSVLAIHRAAGVSKRTSKTARKTRLTAKMRRRHERGLERAETITERTGLKIERSIGKAKVVQARSRGWDEVNARAGQSPVNAFAALGSDSNDDDDNDSDDNEDDKGCEACETHDQDLAGPVAAVPAGMQTSIFAPAPAEHAATDVDDGIL